MHTPLYRKQKIDFDAHAYCNISKKPNFFFYKKVVNCTQRDRGYKLPSFFFGIQLKIQTKTMVRSKRERYREVQTKRRKDRWIKRTYREWCEVRWM